MMAIAVINVNHATTIAVIAKLFFVIVNYCRYAL